MLIQKSFTDKQQNISAAAKLLSHPARVAIIEILHSRNTPLLSRDIASLLPLSRTTVFQHLTALKESSWISASVTGGQISYSVNRKNFHSGTQLLLSFLKEQQSIISSERSDLKEKILFLCTGNSCRSQMAEAFFNNYCHSPHIIAVSAGTTPSEEIHPLAIKVMEEKNISLTNNKPKSTDLFLQDKTVSLIVYVCSNAEKNCPLIFPLARRNVSRTFEDPAEIKGSNETIIRGFRRVRDEIETMILNLIKEIPQE